MRSYQTVNSLGETIINYSYTSTFKAPRSGTFPKLTLDFYDFSSEHGDDLPGQIDENSEIVPDIEEEKDFHDVADKEDTDADVAEETKDSDKAENSETKSKDCENTEKSAKPDEEKNEKKPKFGKSKMGDA